MNRYLKLYKQFIVFSFGRAFQFRLDFFFRVFMDLIYYIVHILFFKIIFLHTKSLGGWDESQIMVFTCGFLWLDSIYMTLFANNLWWFPIYVNRGDLDYYLVRPVESLFFLGLRDFAANSFINFLMASVLFITSLIYYPHPIIWWKLCLYILFLINGAYLYALFYFYSILPVFWTKSSRGLSELYWKSAHLLERPDQIWKGWFRKFLTMIFPMAILASFPAHLFFDDPFPMNVLVHIIGVTVLFSLLAYYLWKRALRIYSSASS